MIEFKFDITVFMCGTSIFYSDMTIISYFNFVFNIVITNPTFSRVLKILIIFFSHYKFFVKIFFHNISTTITFFNHIIIKIANSIFT